MWQNLELEVVKQKVLYYYFFILSLVLVDNNIFLSEVIKYCLFPIVLFVAFFNPIVSLKKYFLVFLLILFITPNITTQYLFEIFFILSGLSILAFYPLSLQKINIVVIFCFLFFLIKNYGSIRLSFSFDAFVKSETSATESNLLSFVAAFLVLFYLRIKEYRMLVISIVLFFLTFKRIVFLGLILALFSLKLNQKALKYIILSLVFLGILFFPILNNPSVKRFLEGASGLSMGHLLQGRFLFYQIGFDQLQQNLSSIIIGNGQGSLVVLLSAKLGYFSLFHGDIFKWFYEHGIIGLICIIYLIRSVRMTPYHLLFVVFMLTDNVLIYTPVLHWLWLMIEREKLHIS